MKYIDFSKHINNVDPQVQWWLNQIIKLLMEYGQVTKPDAMKMLLSSSIPAICDDDPGWLIRERPFYWAMEILHPRQGNIPAGQEYVPTFWWHDAVLWEKFVEYDQWVRSLSEDEKSIKFGESTE